MNPSLEFTAEHLTTAAVIADPYPVYSQLRPQSPFLYTELPAGIVPGLDGPLRGWVLMQHDHVYQALRDHETFTSARNPMDGVIFPKLVLLTDDPPRHTRFRRLVNTAFTMQRIEALTPLMTTIANTLLDAMTGREVEVVQSYSVPLPLRVIAHLLGLPREDYATFKVWSEAALAMSTMTPETRQQHIEDMVAYFGKLVVTRRTTLADDLISAVVEAKVEGEALQDWEVLGFCLLLLIAGNETTTNLIGNMLSLLADRPTLWQQLRKDRSLVEPVIEETLRYETPVQRLFRVTTREVELGGTTIPAGALVTIFFGAANRDPVAFSDPETFRIDRDLRPHVAFGAGIHYCLGAPLTRAEARITLNAFLDRFSTITRGTAAAARQTASDITFGFQQLPLILHSEGD